METRTDEFLPYLQRLIQERQTERTNLMLQVAALDKEIELLQRERDTRTKPRISVPDFPPVIQAVVDTSSITETEEKLQDLADATPSKKRRYVQSGGKASWRDAAMGLQRFTIFEITDLIGVTQSAFHMSKDVKQMLADGVIRKTEEKGRSANGRLSAAIYEFVKPQGPGPTHKPRGERLILPRNTAATGTPVPHTGRVPGSSGKPGQDKKNSARVGRKVGTNRKKKGHA